MKSALCARTVLSWLPHSCWVNFKFFKNNCTSLTDKTLQMYWDGSDEDKTRPPGFWQLQSDVSPRNNKGAINRDSL